jgi:hypothetical protein
MDLVRNKITPEDQHGRAWKVIGERGGGILCLAIQLKVEL